MKKPCEIEFGRICIFSHVFSNLLSISFLPLSYSQKPEEKRVFDYFYKDQKMKSDTKSLPFRRFIQLYSRNSGRHVRIKADRSVDAIGEDGDKYGTSSKTALLLYN